MTPIIKLDQVSVTYPGNTNGSVVALRDVNLQVRPGEFLCVIGPSGCGKSTLLNLMAGFIQPSSGRVTFDGATIAQPGPERAMVFQDAALFPWLSVDGNIDFAMRMQGLGPAQRQRTREQLISLVGLEGFERAHPHELSGGMKQRVAIARALALTPRVLLMDEPFGALDAQTRERLQDELLAIWTRMQTTIVFVTHNVEEATYLGDRVAVISQRPGRVLDVVPVGLERPRSRLEAGMCARKRDLFIMLPSCANGASPESCCACE